MSTQLERQFVEGAARAPRTSIFGQCTIRLHCWYCLHPGKFGANTSGLGLCVKCSKRLSQREQNDDYRAAVGGKAEVLSIGAADAVRSHFSQREIAENFVFKVREFEQLVLSVERLKSRDCGHGEVEYDAGYSDALGPVKHVRYITRRMTYFAPVPFTLLPPPERWRGKRGGRALELAERFWGGFRKVAKAAGVLHGR
jgi:hypothetical protein